MFFKKAAALFLHSVETLLNFPGFLLILLDMNKVKLVINTKLPAFLKGFASAFDITGQTLLDIPDFSSGFQRDTEALRGDWRMVGGDIRKAMDCTARG